MVPFKSSVMMICIIIKIAHAGYYQDLTMCLSQIRHAFEPTRDSATSCLKHAIKFYIKEKRISVPEDLLLEENKIVASSSQSNTDGKQSNSQNLVAQLFQNKSINETTEFWIKDGGQQNAEGSKANDFGISNYDMDDPESLKKWLDSQPWIINEDQPIIKAQQNYPLNYAEQYHKELENMIHGRNVPNRTDFCDAFFHSKKKECRIALLQFGDNAVDAVRKAYSSFTLDLCNKFLESGYDIFIYIKKYMEIIIETCTASPAIKPSKFCQTKMLKKYNLKELPPLD